MSTGMTGGCRKAGLVTGAGSGPYVKGPEDKPLLGGETVWALVR